MSFRLPWVETVMKCVTLATPSILINGVPTGYIIPRRGIRQGDLISPYLFLFCSEGLSGVLRRRMSLGLFEDTGFVKKRRLSPTYCLPMIPSSFVEPKNNRQKLSVYCCISTRSVGAGYEFGQNKCAIQ